MKRVIVLRGLGNSPKSSTLRMLYELLVTGYALERKRGKRVKVSIEGDVNDVNTSVIVSVNGVKVGITSVGDRLGLLTRFERRCHRRARRSRRWQMLSGEAKRVLSATRCKRRGRSPSSRFSRRCYPRQTPLPPHREFQFPSS